VRAGVTAAAGAAGPVRAMAPPAETPEAPERAALEIPPV
jgi:hypothetical protein